MTKYITRIQLQDANENDYQKLNDEMKKELFTLNSERNIWPKKSALPSVEYEREGDMSLTDITGAAYRAAYRTGKTYSFTVIKDKLANKHGKKISE